jgi:hypothetical protein
VPTTSLTARERSAQLNLSADIFLWKLLVRAEIKLESWRLRRIHMLHRRFLKRHALLDAARMVRLPPAARCALRGAALAATVRLPHLGC